MTAMLPDFFKGRVALWFSNNTIDSLSKSLESFTASGLLISFFHSFSGAAGYGFSKRPISNLARSNRETAVLTTEMSRSPDLTSSGIFRKLLPRCQYMYSSRHKERLVLTMNHLPFQRQFQQSIAAW